MKTIFLFIFTLLLLQYSEHQVNADPDLALISDSDVPLILVSTLDGVMTAIDSTTGHVKWKFKEHPLLKTPKSVNKNFIFLPNPQDGQLYFYREHALKKISSSIHQLVQQSPCKTTENVLFAGAKKDEWLAIDFETGLAVETMTKPTKDNSMCLVNNNIVFVGRTEYQLTVRNTSSNAVWNTTYFDYTSDMAPDPYHPNFYLSTPIDGKFLCIDKDSKDILWEKDLESVVVGTYILKKNGMSRLQNIVIGPDTFHKLTKASSESVEEYEWLLTNLLPNQASNKKENHFQLDLFIGKTNDATYAIPTIRNMIHDIPAIVLDKNNKQQYNTEIDVIGTQYSSEDDILGNAIDMQRDLYGYKNIPRIFANELNPLVPNDQKLLSYIKDPNINRDKAKIKKNVNQRVIEDKNTEEKKFSMKGFIYNSYENYPKETIIFLLTISTTFTIFYQLYHRTFKTIPQEEKSSTTTYNNSNPSTRPNSQTNSFSTAMNNAIAVNGYTAILGTAISEILHDGHFAIGKLKYHNKDVLGEGCHGTIVFQGEFDGRRVAIKKVFSRMVDIVDREINILRDSDSHANVIRYFCSESNADFTFIALELCDFSLGQFIRNRDRFPEVNIEDLDILKQSALGVAHLHSLKIVHRDLKPENILIAKNTATGITRVLISDFGLCKRLKQDSQSISRVSGAVGTEGWKAPEMEMKNGSVTVAVDIFALGCIYYFVLSKGRHPFGEGNVRQNNIMKKSKGDLSLIKGNANVYFIITNPVSDNELSVHLIESMIQYIPSFRPSAKSCLAHPLFWSNDKQLQFFLIVSDRIEKEEEDSEIRKILEYGAQSVINKNWNKYICKDLEEDLRKYRAYRHDQVRDLLRAIRNKKNHYRELPDALRQSLGDIPDHFLNYFTSRFPKLMLHVYKSMNYCAKESIFQRYYKESHAAFFKQPFDSMFSIDEEYEDSKFEGAILLPGVSYAAIMKNAPKQFSPHNVNTNHQDPNFTNVVKKDVRHRRRPANRGQDKKS